MREREEEWEPTFGGGGRDESEQANKRTSKQASKAFLVFTKL